MLERAQEETESNADGICERSCLEGHGWVGAAGAVEEELDQCDGQWFDLFWGRVGFAS